MRITLAIFVISWIIGGCSNASSGSLGVTGIVINTEDKPVQGATVRFRGKPDFTLTDELGRFAITDVTPYDITYLTASAPGYYITQSDHYITRDTKFVALTLKPLHNTDNPDYEFVSALLGTDNRRTCATCHSDKLDASDVSLPVDEWLKDAHAFSTRNPRFLSLYNGTAFDGQSSSPTTYTYDASIGINRPYAPSLAMDEAGPGFRLDFPDNGGNCASCHAPIAALSEAFGADPNHADGVEVEGVTCDLCHKIRDITLTANHLPLPGQTGILSYELNRPRNNDEQIFFGPFDDAPGEDAYLPLMEQSQFCAGCHHAEFWGVTIYNSYGEWLESRYNGIMTCQDCHMPQGNSSIVAQVPEDDETHVPIRDPQTVFSHQMPGASDIELLRSAATLNVEAEITDSGLQVDVVVQNTGTGHHMPTGSPLRNMILLVTVQDEDGQRLPQLSGPTVPDWGGIGIPDEGYYAGLAGVGYARILADIYTDESPTYAYWRQTYVVSDNRIPAFESDRSSYVFTIGEGKIAVTAKLILRRAFIDLMDVKQWDIPDIVMIEQTILISNE